EFPLFGRGCTFTDDTVMTIAVADALMNGGKAGDYVRSLKRFGAMFPHAGYGGRFHTWLFSEDSAPYNSWGNGSAMRVSPVGWFFDSLEATERAAEASAAVTHNHPEGIKGAQATAAAIFLARTGVPKEDMRAYLEDAYGYDLHRTLDEIRPTYAFDESCMRTVPEAVIAFLESGGFEDAIRNAISLGGDSDTLAAITGSIAEAAYGMPEGIRDKTVSYLDEALLEVLIRWQDKMAQ
ncbi:MAG: ADP-ribosylglycohydrolase family protein, partial [Eggerthellaceae bacterium]|nr:ADP-ribosylglycohydrolase family protein [Eggerthellaceae bacterium]